MTTTTDMLDGRAATIASLRALADLLDRHPDLPVPYALTCPMLVFPHRPAAEVADMLARLGGTWTLDIGDDSMPLPVQLSGRLAGLPVTVCISTGDLGEPLADRARIEAAADRAFPHARRGLLAGVRDDACT